MMNNTQPSSMTVKFWGVRGSHPVPGRSVIQFGGNTPSVEVTAGGQTILLDAGTGIIPLGRDLVQRAKAHPIEAVILFSHLHHDHTQGFPFFIPAFIPATRLALIAPDIFGRDPVEVLEETMESPKFPIPFHNTASKKRIYRLKENQVVVIRNGRVDLRSSTAKISEKDAVVVRSLWSHAHPQGVLFYRIEWGGRAVVYATDTEGYLKGDQRLIRFAWGADLLIHDTQYTEEHYTGQRRGFPPTQGFGHSTPAMAAEVAKSAGVKQLALFHFDPTYDDRAIANLEVLANETFPNTVAAYEGLEITLAEETRADQRRNHSDTWRQPPAGA